MSEALATQESAEVQPSILTVIANAAKDPSVDPQKMIALLELQERIMHRESVMAFNAAMARLQKKLPTISKDGAIEYSGKRQTYSKYEHIDEEIRPHLLEEGFSFSFNSVPLNNESLYEATLSHSGGHSIKASIALPYDKSGGKNDIQARGSASSYARRYLVCMMLNIITKDQDDDGNGGPVTPEQLAELVQLVKDSGANLPLFLKYMKVKTLNDIPRTQFQQAKTKLQEKLKGK